MIYFVFWSFFGLVILHYVAYPALVLVIAGRRGSGVRKGPMQPRVSLIIAAYNEQAVIDEKLQNTLELSYPRELLEIIVVSDGSSDATASRVECYAHQGVISLHLPERRGKTAALNRAVLSATGEILIFSDANAIYSKDAISRLVENFADESVGGVCGRKNILKEEGRDSSAGDGLFWRVEAALKSAESALGSIPTADGEIFAVRRDLFLPVAEDTINDDTAITFDIVKQGRRVVYEPGAVATESASITLREDMAVKARMVYGGYQSLARNRAWLLPPSNWFGLQFLIHKTLRHMMPFVLLGLFLCSLAMSGTFYSLFLWAQVLFYLTAGAAAIGHQAGFSLRYAYVPLYYCAMNVSALTGFAYYLKRRALTDIWTKAQR